MNIAIDKIYCALFFWVGFAWFSHSVKFAWPAMCSLVAFYFLHNAILVKRKNISNAYKPFLLLGTFMIFHCLASNLDQLIAFTDNAFYRTWSGISTGARMFMDVSCLYVMFRCISRLREEGSGLFFKYFSHGANVFLTIFLLTGHFSLQSIMIAKFGGVDGTEAGFYVMGESLGINNIAPLFLQFFFMNLLAYMHEKRKYVKYYHAIFIVLDLIVMFFAQSKTSMGSLIISMIVVFILKKPKYSIITIIAIAFMASLFFGNAEILSEILPGRYNPDVVSASMRGGATGRTDRWREYMTNAISNKTLLVGHGYGVIKSVLYQKPATIEYYIPGYSKVTSLNYNSVSTPHSFYVQFFVEEGGIALLVYLLIMSKILFRLIIGVVHRKTSGVYLAMYIVLIVECIFQMSIFNDMFLLFYAVVLPEVCNNVDKGHSMITIKDFCGIFLKRIFIISGVAAVVMGVSLWHCQYSTTIYKSSCVVIPSTYNRSLGRFPGTVIARILRGDTIVTKAAEKFDLMNVYGKHSMTETVNYMKENIIHTKDILLGNMITLEVLDTSPDRAVKISDFMLNCLNTHMHEIYAATNSSLETFYSNAADTIRADLIDAENALVQFQKDNGVITANPQIRSLLGRISSLRNQISAKELEIYRLKSYASTENVKLKLAQTQLEAMRNELEKLEASNENFALEKIPAATIEYNNRMRRVQVLAERLRNASNDLMSVRNDLREVLPPVHMVEVADGSVQKFKPYKTAIMIIATFTGAALGVLVSLLHYNLKRA